MIPYVSQHDKIKVANEIPPSLERAAVLAAAAAVLPFAALCADHSNLEEGLPTAVEDAYPIAAGGREVQPAARYERQRDGKNLFLLDSRLEFGFAPNWQGKIAVPVRLGSADKAGSGDVQLEAL